MKLSISCAITLFVALVCVRGEVTTPAPQKTCTDFLPAQTCSLFTNVIKNLNERASTLQEAINAAVKAHKTNAKEMTDFVRTYIAENLQCEKVLSPDTCTKLTSIRERLHLTRVQLQMAIEKAVAAGKSSAKDIYNNVISTLKGEISCEKVLGITTCNNIIQGMAKFHEQRALLKEAIMTVVTKSYNNTKDTATMVRKYLVSKVTNFECENVMTATLCKNITDVVQILKLAPGAVRDAIEEAVLYGGQNVRLIYERVISNLTPLIKCEVIIGQTSCENFKEATKKFRERATLVKEALMQAALKHTKNVRDIYNSVKTKLMESAKNFQCTDVLGKDTCENLVDFGNKLNIKKDAVTEAIKEAILEGKENLKSASEFVKKLLVEEESCNQFMGKFLCKALRFSAWAKGVTFDKVMDKIKDLYAKGVTTRDAILVKVKEFFGIATFKRSIGSGGLKAFIKDKMVQTALRLAEKLSTLEENVKSKIKSELEKSKLTAKNMLAIVKDLLAKYVKNEQMDEDTFGNLGQRISELKQKLRQRMSKLFQKLKDLINKLPAGESAQAEMRIKGMEKMIEEEIEKEVEKAIKSFL